MSHVDPRPNPLSAEEVSARFRSDPENERLYQESVAKLDRTERAANPEDAE